MLINSNETKLPQLMCTPIKLEIQKFSQHISCIITINLQTENEKLKIYFPNMGPESLKVIALKIIQKSTASNRHGSPPSHTKLPSLKCGLKM